MLYELPSLSWVASPLIGLALAPWCWFVVRRTNRPKLMGTVAVVAAASLPLWLSTELTPLRTVVAVAAVTLTAKCHELARQRVCDPTMLDSFGWMCAWLYLPPDTTRARTSAEAVTTRRLGTQSLLRGLAKVPVLGSLLVIATIAPQLHEHVASAVAWALAMTYLCLSSLSDVASGLVMFTGLRVAPMFDKPPLARSPRDFWGRRWNLFISSWAFRNVFIPMGGRRRPALATLGVFTASGLMHEYIVFAGLGHAPRHLGWMMAFFMLHGVAAVFEISLARQRQRRPLFRRPVAIAAHVAWFACTAPLFFAPFDEALWFTRWRLW